MARPRKHAAQRHQARTLRIEWLEVRDLLSATSLQYDHVAVPAASSGISGYTPAQIRAAYGITGIAGDGTGQTIAIIDAYDDPNIASDLAAFDQAFGIAAPPSLKIVNQSGGSTLPGTDPNRGWEGETALDVEWAHAIAPGATILLVEARSASDTDLFAAVNYARQQPGVSVISMSWGSDDSAANRAYDQSLSSQYLVTPSGHQGITFVASSGDDGHPSFPAESPNVLAVGGTDLYLTSSGSITKETAWTPTTSGGQTWSGGGGVSTEFSGRKVPDVAYNAGIGFAVYDTFGANHGWVTVGGTSAGAPQWAALIAIANQQRAQAGLGSLDGAKQTLAAIYAAPAADFHDITTGSTQFQTATVGYDLATGRGSPVANLLVPYLASYGASATGGTSTAPTAPKNFTATALSSTQVSLTWTDATGETTYNLYEIQNTQPVLIATYAAGTTSATISGLTAGTSYAFNLVAVNAAGSAATPWVQVTTLAATVPLTAPLNFQATATSSSTALLTWNATAGATGYRVYEWTGTQTVQVATLGAGATSTTISGLPAGATTYFYVSAYNATSSAATGWVGVTLPSVPTLTAPTNLAAKATSSTTGTLSWSAVAGATGYVVYYWNGSQAVSLATVGSATTSVSIQGLSAGKTTYFGVMAYNSTTSAASNWVALTTPTARTIAAADAVFADSSALSYRWRTLL